MKTKIKRHSRTVLSIVLTLCMLVSCMTVGLIATDAAKTADERVGAKADDEALGDTAYYLWYATNNSISSSDNYTCAGEMSSLGGSKYYQSFTAPNGNNIAFFVSTSNSSMGTGLDSDLNVDSIGSNSSKVTYDSAKFNAPGTQDFYSGGTRIYAVRTSVKQSSSMTVYVTYDRSGSPHKYDITASVPSGGGSGGDTPTPSDEIGTEVTDDSLLKILNGTDVSFYIESYTDKEWTDLCNSSNEAPTYTRYGKIGTRWGKSYVQIAKTDRTGYDRITNNKSGWNGDENTAIKTATGGEHFVKNGTGNVSAVQSYTTINPSYRNTDTMSISTISDNAKTAFTEDSNKVFDMTLKYYIKSGDKYYYLDGKDKTASTTAQTTSYPLANLSAGSYELITLAVDSEDYVRYIADTDEFTVSLGEAKTITVNSNSNVLGTATSSVATAYSGQSVTITATPTAGGVFSNWRVNSGDVTVVNSTSASTTFVMGDSDVVITANFAEYLGESSYYYNGYNTDASQVSGKFAERMSVGKLGDQQYSYYHVTGRTGNQQLMTVSYGNLDYDNSNTWVYFVRPSWDDTSLWGNSESQYAMFYSADQTIIRDWEAMAGDGDATGGYRFKTQIPDRAVYVRFKDGSTQHQTSLINLNNKKGGTYSHNGFYLSSSTHSDSTYTDIGTYDVVDGYNKIPDVYEWYQSSTNNGTVYKNYAETVGFGNHGVTEVNAVGNASYHRFAKPNTSSSDYYVLVLYQGVEYYYNGTTILDNNNIVVLIADELPTQSTVDTVKVYAKDGAIRRDNDSPERNDRTYSIFEQHANTFIYSDSGYTNHIGTRSSYDGATSEGTGYNGYTFDYKADFEKGQTLYIKTEIDSTYRATHYLAAYCINGTSYVLHAPSESDDGVVTEAFTVPEDWEDKYVEITPIYFLRDTAGTNTLTFYVEGYDQTVMDAGWGNTPSVYPFYQDADNNYVSNINNAYGGYPGQPLVFYRGNYYAQLPKSIQTTIGTGSEVKTCTIKGVTLGNNYWDDIHVRTGEVSAHLQTYDFDDLYKIYKEHDNAKNIICSFKYRKAYNNDEPSSFTTGTSEDTYKNGWEVLTDYYGRPVDVFGNLIYGEDIADIPADVKAAIDEKDPAEKTAKAIALKNDNSENLVHAISQDYKSNCAGEYGTEWAIYNTDGTKVTKTGSGAKTTIVPSALAITDTTHFSDYDAQTRAFQGIYDVLKADTKVKNKLTIISYEQSIAGGGNYADRCDARWYFSQTDSPISATTMIEYSDDDGKTWTKDAYTTGTGTGSHTGAKAYFTGTATIATDTPTVTTGIDGTNTTTLGGTTGGGYYTFKAENNNGTNGNYEFVGWYILRDNYQNITVRNNYAISATKFASHAEMAKNGDIFVARFKKTTHGTFDIYHEVHPQTTGYGDVYVEAVVLDSNEAEIAASKVGSIDTSSPATLTSHVQIPSTYIATASNNKVKATFKAVPYPTSTFDNFYATVQSLLNGFTGYNYIDSININDETNTATVIYDVNKMFSGETQTVSSVTHYSKFSLSDELSYTLEYVFKTRYYGDKRYDKSGTFTEDELRSYFSNQISDKSKSSIQLTKQFVQAKAPFESNYREDLTWVVDSVVISSVSPGTDNHGKLIATQVPKKWAKAKVYDFNDAGNMVTHDMEAPFDKIFKSAVTAKPENSAEAEAMLSEWGDPSNDQLYSCLRTSYNGNPVYIDHWDIYQLDSFTYNKVNKLPKMKDGINLDVDLGKSVLVAQTYSSKFNYVGYEDYAIVPVYSTEYVDRQTESDKRTDSAATLISITRNHWNNTVSGNDDSAELSDGSTYKYNLANTEYDRVYIDFMLNYNYSKEINGKQTNVLLSSTGDNIKVGFVVRSYTVEGNTRHYSAKSQTVLVNKGKIDDKNRLEYCYGFKNSENNSRAGLYYEFKPFIVDTNNPTTGEGDKIIIDEQEYTALYAVESGKELAGVSFYMIGKADTSWSNH